TGSISWYGQRSLPQMQARVTATSASVGSIRRASGTFSMRTSPAPYRTVARIATYLALPAKWTPMGFTGTKSGLFRTARSETGPFLQVFGVACSLDRDL